jgi:hypothetical protein
MSQGVCQNHNKAGKLEVETCGRTLLAGIMEGSLTIQKEQVQIFFVGGKFTFLFCFSRVNIQSVCSVSELTPIVHCCRE